MGLGIGKLVGKALGEVAALPLMFAFVAVGATVALGAMLWCCWKEWLR